jgi:hypothetical protein
VPEFARQRDDVLKQMEASLAARAAAPDAVKASKPIQ